MSSRQHAVELLRRLTGDDAVFRPHQWEAIEELVERRGRVLVVQRTGWGKSAVYFVATRMLRDEGAGPTVLVSPLLALMRNQIEMAARAGVSASTINSGNREEWEEIEERIRAGAVDVLLISPERLNNERFRRDVLPDLAKTVGLLVVDEAHCISDWGHDFRPDYRRIAQVLTTLPRDVPVLCTTATANDRVVADIAAQFEGDLSIIRGPLERESLRLAVIDLPDAAERLAWLAEVIPTLPGAGIVYCLTIADTDRVSRWLKSRGIDAVAYSGQSEHEARIVFEDALLGNKVKVVVATSALGMGFDKPDLAFVVHFQSPGSPIAYYQQVGRAGRALDSAAGVLLRGTEDAEIQDWFIRTAFPPQDKAEAVIELLETADAAVSMGEMERTVNIRRTRLTLMLKVLELEGAVERASGGWRRTSQPWSYDAERTERVTALRRQEQAAMVDYATTPTCRMAFLRGQLDDPAAEPCGRCDRCAGPFLPETVDSAVTAEAVQFLRSAALEIEPRLQWPAGLGEPRGKIPPDHQLRPGRALSVYNDAGWGRLVARARQQGRRFPDDLVDAAARLVEAWSPDPAPTWLTFIPSASSPGLVEDLAERLASRLHLPLHDVVRRVRPGRLQHEMENSPQQLRNVYGAFEIAAAVPTEPVLLVDDLVDSRWTLTVVGVALRDVGSAEVHPLAIAKGAGS